MKLVGYALGLLMLADGALAAMSPRWWTDLEWPFVSRFTTREEAQALDDLKRIPSATLRSWGIWESVFGLLMLALAGRIADTTRAPARSG